MDSLLDFDQELLAPPWGSLGRDAVLGAVAGVTKLLLNVLNSTRAINHDTYLDLVMHRPPGVGLLTISNHTSTYDDPGLPCALLPLSFFWSEHSHQKNRWTMCAKDICFTNEFFRQFFLNGKVLPVERGAGVSQDSVGVAARALGRGDWLHIFPEGRVVPSGQVGPFRQGIGKLICEARAVQGRDPIVLPFFHSGMSRVMPFKSMVPRLGQQVVVAVGQPLDLSHITCRCNKPGEDQAEVWRDLAVALRHAVTELQDQVPPNPNQLERPHVAAYEAQYQERMRQAREQQRLAGGSGLDPSLMVKQQWPQQQQQEEQEGGVVGAQAQRSRQGGGYLQQQQQEVEQDLTAEQEWQLQQQQLLAVVRRVYRQQQVELEHIVDISMHQQGEQQQQQQQQQQEQQKPLWQDLLQKKWQQGQQLLQTWQQLQDRQVAMLLARSKGSRDAGGGGSSGGAEPPSSPASAGGSSKRSSSSSSWSWVAWPPFISKAAAAAASQHHQAASEPHMSHH